MATAKKAAPARPAAQKKAAPVKKAAPKKAAGGKHITADDSFLIPEAGTMPLDVFIEITRGTKVRMLNNAVFGPMAESKIIEVLTGHTIAAVERGQVETDLKGSDLYKYINKGLK